MARASVPPLRSAGRSLQQCDARSPQDDSASARQLPFGATREQLAAQDAAQSCDLNADRGLTVIEQFAGLRVLGLDDVTNDRKISIGIFLLEALLYRYLHCIGPHSAMQTARLTLLPSPALAARSAAPMVTTCSAIRRSSSPDRGSTSNFKLSGLGKQLWVVHRRVKGLAKSVCSRSGAMPGGAATERPTVPPAAKKPITDLSSAVLPSSAIAGTSARSGWHVRNSLNEDIDLLVREPIGSIPNARCS